MPVKRAIHLECGGTLLLHHDGKKTYIPSKSYRQNREVYLNPKPSKRKPETVNNCSKLLEAILRYYIERQSNKKGASGWGFIHINK